MAIYGKRRTATWHDCAATFVLHRETSRASVGFLTGSIPGDASSEAARAQCSEILSGAGTRAPEWTHYRTDPGCWTILDPVSARSYKLQRHHDGWALVTIVSEISGQRISEPADLTSWADEAIKFRFTMQRQLWQRGPSTDCPSALTLYSDIQGQLAVNDVDDMIMGAIFQMY